jgi:DNA-binding response OmpR family regulator
MSTAGTSRILLVEDDPSIALGLVDALEFEGFRVTHAKSGRTGIERATAEKPDCILLDLMLPDMNGYQVCSDIRRSNARVPIIMLTARSQETDKIRGLDAGADDYITKPFSVGELVARIRAILRRVGAQRADDTEGPFSVGQARIDPVRQLVTQAGAEMPLTFHELELLKLLFARAGRVVSRDEILEKVWGLDATTSTRTVDNTVVKLRKKIEPADGKTEHILTVYGVGYKLVVAGVPSNADAAG